MSAPNHDAHRDRPAPGSADADSPLARDGVSRPGPVSRRGNNQPAPDVPAEFALQSTTLKLDTLVHELSSLLDGTTRTVGLLLRSKPEAQAQNTQLSDDARRLRSVKAALDQMTGMVHAAVHEGVAEPGRARRLAARSTASLSLRDAVDHATAILEPLAAEHGAVVRVDVTREAGHQPAGPVYSLVLNGVKNAIESVAQLRAGSEREISVSARLEESAVVIEIRDNGLGLPATTRAGSKAGQPFTPGFSTKPGGAGLGLAFCRELLMLHGGTVRLTNLQDEPGSDRGTTAKRGAVLRARYPMRTQANNTKPGSNPHRQDAA